MANKMILMIKLRPVFRFHIEGKSKRLISKLTGVSGNTVKRYITEFIELRLTADVIGEMSDHQLEELFGKAEEPKPNDRFESVAIF